MIRVGGMRVFISGEFRQNLASLSRLFGRKRESEIPVPRNVVSFSSARTTKRFRCGSAIQIVRPSPSTGETQPRLQPALLRLSAIISQYFILDPLFTLAESTGIRLAAICE